MVAMRLIKNLLEDIGGACVFSLSPATRLWLTGGLHKPDKTCECAHIHTHRADNVPWAPLCSNFEDNPLKPSGRSSNRRIPSSRGLLLGSSEHPSPVSWCHNHTGWRVRFHGWLILTWNLSAFNCGPPHSSHARWNALQPVSRIPSGHFSDREGHSQGNRFGGWSILSTFHWMKDASHGEPCSWCNAQRSSSPASSGSTLTCSARSRVTVKVLLLRK